MSNVTVYQVTEDDRSLIDEFRRQPVGHHSRDLQRLLNDRQSQRKSLDIRRKRLQKELDVVEGRIDELEGQGRGPRRRRGGRRAVKRPNNVKSLHEFVKDVLSKNKKGCSLKDLIDNVLSAGYKTNSSNFKNVLYQCVYNSKDVKHDDKTGAYRLVKPANRKAKKPAKVAAG